jgi:hypothetical protein
LDLRVKKRSPVYATVSGSVEAGHYGYTNNPDGSSEKYWHPWPAGGDRNYFEIAVVSPEGYRFEFHHMDENKISAEVLALLQAGGGEIKAGALLGNTVAWPDGVYHHTHYNIISPSGVQLNPEFFSPLLDDGQAPDVSSLFAVFSDDRTEDFADGNFEVRPDFFAATVIDHNDKNIYDHPPVYAAITFEDGMNYTWDFSEFLLGPNGKFPSIWNFYIESIRGPDGKNYATEGGYGVGQSVIKIPVPAEAHGNFKIKISDQAKNSTSFSGNITGN